MTASSLTLQDVTMKDAAKLGTGFGDDCLLVSMGLQPKQGDW
jgi:hypothetical protein